MIRSAGRTLSLVLCTCKSILVVPTSFTYLLPKVLLSTQKVVSLTISKLSVKSYIKSSDRASLLDWSTLKTGKKVIWLSSTTGGCFTLLWALSSRIS